MTRPKRYRSKSMTRASTQDAKRLTRKLGGMRKTGRGKIPDRKNTKAQVKASQNYITRLRRGR